MAADDDQLAEWTSELLRFPLSVPRDTTISPWPDPMMYFPIDRVDTSSETTSVVRTEIETSINWLLRRARSESGEGRDRAISRLALACIAGLMSEPNRASFGTLLWDGIGVTGVPKIPNLSDFNYLHLPHPDDIDVVSRTKEKRIGSPIERIVSVASGRISVSGKVVEEMTELAAASKPIVRLLGEFRGVIEWSSDEREKIWKEAIEWWENEKHEFSLDYDFTTGYVAHNIRMLGSFMQRLVPSMDLSNDDEWRRVVSILSVARDSGVYLTAVLPYILIGRSTEWEEVGRTISGDLVSQEESRAEAGAEAVRHWIHLADADVVEGPPSEIIDELIYAVAFRRSAAIRSSMKQLSYLLFEKGDAVSVDQVKLLVSSLPAWADAVQIPIVDGGIEGFPEEDRPELRVGLGELASVLSRWLNRSTPDEPEPGAISRLRESYASDNLPEVRRAFGRWMRFDAAIAAQGQ